jgi:signal peptidase I
MKKRQSLLLALVVMSAVGFSVAFYCEKNLGAYSVSDTSMVPTYPVESPVLAWTHAYDLAAPRRGDVALVELPISQLGIWRAKGTATIVRRVIGVPGDLIEFKRGVLTVDGRVESEPFAKWILTPPYDLKIVDGKVYKGNAGWWSLGNRFLSRGEGRNVASSATQSIPPNFFLILGDNRDGPKDSVWLGLLPRSVFKGRVLKVTVPKIQIF